jgi:cyclopropane-fatty-acyl-phospholipid synthase
MVLDLLIDRGWVPEPLLCRGSRFLIWRRLREEQRAMGESLAVRTSRFLERTRGSRIAEHPEAANEQHYEVPAAFFERVLGPRMKYSCCWFGKPDSSLEEAEEAMLRLTADRAQLEDGLRVLDLGCGWGSFTLWAGERYPKSSFLAVSNSESQGAFLKARAKNRGLTNVKHLRVDVNSWQPEGSFDRIVTVEMLEHVRDHRLLFARLRQCLAPGGKLFVHVFCHSKLAYPFENHGPSDWMSRNFFTGGIMPSSDLLPALAEGTWTEEDRVWIPGTHYARTAQAWLTNLKQNRAELEKLLSQPQEGWPSGKILWRRWRLFFLACRELFGFRNGKEWGVVHHRFS